MFYIIICKIYGFFINIIEVIFFKNSHTISSLERNGYSFYFKENNKFEDLDKFKNIIENKYQKLFIYDAYYLENIIKSVFTSKFRNYITNQTGFEYSIDFFTCYANSYISKKDKNKGWYGNIFHFDKPYSRNMLKVLVPLKDLGIDDGPLILLPKYYSKLYKKNSDLSSKFIPLIGKKGSKLIFSPNVCLHMASSPKINNSAYLMMFQLNPSKKWSYNKTIAFRQKYKEPKFTFFAYIFNQKKIFKLNQF